MVALPIYFTVRIAVPDGDGPIPFRDLYSHTSNAIEQSLAAFAGRTAFSSAGGFKGTDFYAEWGPDIAACEQLLDKTATIGVD